MILEETFTLANGIVIPKLGLGTWRIDHILLNQKAAARLVAAEVDRRPRNWDKTSDHAPVWLELGDWPRNRRKGTKPLAGKANRSS